MAGSGGGLVARLVSNLFSRGPFSRPGFQFQDDRPKMKVIILAAGHGTRLDKDLRGDGGKNYRHLLGVPKPLLPVGGKALATKWMEILNDCSSHHLSLNEAIVVVCTCLLWTACSLYDKRRPFRHNYSSSQAL